MLLLREQERPRCGLTLNQWYELWLNEYKCTTVKQGTVDSYRCMYEYYIRDTLGDKLLAEIRSDELQRFFNDMNRSGYSKSTLSLTSVVIGSMFRQAVKNDLIGRNPVDACTLPRGRKKVAERQALSERQQERLLEAAQGNPVEGILRLALGTGMRIGEITGLQWSDINWKKEELYVRTTLNSEGTEESSIWIFQRPEAVPGQYRCFRRCLEFCGRNRTGEKQRNGRRVCFGGRFRGWNNSCFYKRMGHRYRASWYGSSLAVWWMR